MQPLHVAVVSKKGISELSLNSVADLSKYFMATLLKLRQKKKNRNLSRRRGIYTHETFGTPHDLQNNNTFNE